MPSESESIALRSTDRDGAVVSLTLNRPSVGNAYNGELIDALHDELDEVEAAESIRVAVLRGNGPHFQAGADLKWLDRVARSSPEENLEASRRTAELARRIDRLPIPTVALVRGGCFGGGTGLIACCDVVIAADDSRFAISETRRGMGAGIILPQLANAIGLRQLRRLALTGEVFDSQEAMRIGLAHIVCPSQEIEERCSRVVESILLGAPGATAATKKSLGELAAAAVPESLCDALVRQHADLRQTDEAAEGIASFHEKRKPAWTDLI
jgi:methylglutaconyl-CoA hydratase